MLKKRRKPWTERLGKLSRFAVGVAMILACFACQQGSEKANDQSGTDTNSVEASAVSLDPPKSSTACPVPGKALANGERPNDQVAVLLHEGDPGVFRLARRLTSDDFAAYHELLSANGFYLHDFEVVSEVPTVCFSGLWYEGEGGQVLELGAPYSRFADALVGKDVGDVETYRRAGNRVFAGVWREDSAERDFDFDISDPELRSIATVGRKIEDIESWSGSGKWHHMVIHSGKEAKTELHLRQSRLAFGEELRGLIERGYRPLEFQIETMDGKRSYTSVWEDSAQSFWFFLGLNEADQDCRLVSLGFESPSLAPHDLARCRGLRSADDHFGGQLGAEESVGDDENHFDDPTGLLVGRQLPTVPLRVLDFVFSSIPVGGREPVEVSSAAATPALTDTAQRVDSGATGPASTPAATGASGQIPDVPAGEFLDEDLGAPGPLVAVPQHQGVIHDTGPSGPGG